MFKRLVPILLGLCMLGMFSTVAHAETQGVGWDVQARTFPTYMVPGEKGAIELNVVNIGAADSAGTVTVTDSLPTGVVATGAGSFEGKIRKVVNDSFENEQWDCVGNGPGGAVAGASLVTCTNDASHLPHIAGGGVPTRGAGTLPDLRRRTVTRS